MFFLASKRSFQWTLSPCVSKEAVLHILMGLNIEQQRNSSTRLYCKCFVFKAQQLITRRMQQLCASRMVWLLPPLFRLFLDTHDALFVIGICAGFPPLADFIQWSCFSLKLGLVFWRLLEVAIWSSVVLFSSQVLQLLPKQDVIKVIEVLRIPSENYIIVCVGPT